MHINYLKTIFIIGLMSIILVIVSCHSDESVAKSLKDSILISKDTASIADKDSLTVDTLPNVTYSILRLNDSTLKQIKKHYQPEHLKTICALNRIDSELIHRADSLIIPDSFYVDLINYSPFPLEFPKADSILKLIMISYPLQAFAVYDTGRLVRWGPLSMGKRTTQTPVGLFHTNWKSKSQISTDNADWILPWYFNLINSTGVSLHQFELPGFPASHSCIRLREEDAQWIYYYADQWKLDSKGWKILIQGTPVIIFGKYPFGEARPWFSLAIDSKSNRISAYSLDKEISPFYDNIIREQKARIQFYSDTLK